MNKRIRYIVPGIMIFIGTILAFVDNYKMFQIFLNAAFMSFIFTSIIIGDKE